MLAGKLALVTGSSRGIGWETARVFARSGATVILNGREPSRLETRRKELSAEAGREMYALAFDVSDAGTVRNAYQDIFKSYGRLDILVNNAGILQDALLGMIADEMIDRSFKVNAFGALYNLQAAARLMGRAGAGAIINVSSIIGTSGNEGQTLYGSTKAALIGLTRSAAKELAPKGIRVNAVAPGFIDTEMTRQLPIQSGSNGSRASSCVGSGGQRKSQTSSLSWPLTSRHMSPVRLSASMAEC